MTDKTAHSPPILTLPAALEEGVCDYLGQIAEMAGWQTAKADIKEESEKTAKSQATTLSPKKEENSADIPKESVAAPQAAIIRNPEQSDELCLIFPAQDEAAARRFALHPEMKAGRLIKALRDERLRAQNGPEEINFGPYILQVHDAILQKEGGNPLRLTEKEVEILLALHQAGRALSREELLDGVWSYASGVETHTLETHIYRLRQKIEEDPSRPTILITEDDGYRLID